MDTPNITKILHFHVHGATSRLPSDGLLMGFERLLNDSFDDA